MSHERSSFGDYCIRCRRTLIREDERRRADDLPDPLYDEEVVDALLAERPGTILQRPRRIG